MNVENILSREKGLPLGEGEEEGVEEEGEHGGVALGSGGRYNCYIGRSVHLVDPMVTLVMEEISFTSSLPLQILSFSIPFKDFM